MVSTAPCDGSPVLEYISTGANPTAGAVAWGPAAVLAHTAGPTVALYDTEVCEEERGGTRARQGRTRAYIGV